MRFRYFLLHRSLCVNDKAQHRSARDPRARFVAPQSSTTFGEVVGLVGQEREHAVLPARQVQAHNVDRLGFITIVDDLYCGRAISVGESGDVQSACRITGNSGTDSGCSLADEARAEVCMGPQSLCHLDLGSVVDEQQRLIVLERRSAFYAISLSFWG